MFVVYPAMISHVYPHVFDNDLFNLPPKKGPQVEPKRHLFQEPQDLFPLASGTEHSVEAHAVLTAAGTAGTAG